MSNLKWDYRPDPTTSAAILGAISKNLDVYMYFAGRTSTITAAAKDDGMEVPSTSLYRSVNRLKDLGIIVETGESGRTEDGRKAPVYGSAFEKVLIGVKDGEVGMRAKLSKYGRRAYKEPVPEQDEPGEDIRYKIPA